MFGIDTIRAVFTYLTVLVVVIGGMAMIYYTRDEASATEIRLLIAGFIGSALTFAFNTEVQTRTARQSAAATLAAASTTTIDHSNGSTTAGT